MKVCFYHYVTKPRRTCSTRLGRAPRQLGPEPGRGHDLDRGQREVRDGPSAGGVFFYKYLVKLPGNGFKWQDGANLPPARALGRPRGGLHGGRRLRWRHQEADAAQKLISTEKEKVQLRVEANKAKEDQAALQELLIAREELNKAQEKLAAYEGNVQTAFNGQLNGGANQR